MKIITNLIHVAYDHTITPEAYNRITWIAFTKVMKTKGFSVLKLYFAEKELKINYDITTLRH